MNNIHEDDWADDTWSRHSGMFVPDICEKPDENDQAENSPEENCHTEK